MTKIDHFKNLVNKIQNKKLKVSVIGLGYVGLPLSLFIAKNNFNVSGIDLDKKKILKTYKTQYLLSNFDNKSKKFWKKNFRVFNNYEKIVYSDLIIICVPTPLKSNKKPDLSYLSSVLKGLKGKLSKGTLIALESTSYPGTTKEFFIDPFEKDFKIGEELFIGFSPERIDPNRNENKLDKLVFCCVYFKFSKVVLLSIVILSCKKKGVPFSNVLKSILPFIIIILYLII